ATRGTTGNFDAPAPCVSEKLRTAKQIPSCPLCIRLNDRCFNIEWIDGHLNSARIKKRQQWCQRRDLNPRPKAYESSALPLSYSGICTENHAIGWHWASQRHRIPVASNYLPINMPRSNERASNFALRSRPRTADWPGII